MNDAPAREYKPRLLPSSPIELVQFDQETLGRFVHKDKDELIIRKWRTIGSEKQLHWANAWVSIYGDAG